MMAETFISEALRDCNSMPWDEASEFPTRALQVELDTSSIDGNISGKWRRVDEAQAPQKLKQEEVEISSIDDSVSDQWRRIGEARRRLILEEDRLKGGTAFDLNKNCNVDRYFQVAHRVSLLDRFVLVNLATGWSI
jgi:hypothetical protein